MDFTRRQFIQVTGATAAGLAVSGLGFDLKPIKAHAQMLKTEYAKQTTSICPYCAVGCGVIVYTSQKGDGRVIDIDESYMPFGHSATGAHRKAGSSGHIFWIR